MKSKFEQLPNELLYYVFDYFNGFEIFNSFYYLNQRFNFLLENYRYTFKCLNWDEFVTLYFKIISHIPLQQFKALSAKDNIGVEVDFFLNCFLTERNISQLSHLQTLQIIANHSYKSITDNLEYAVKKLSQLNNLIHLTIQIPTLDLGVELVQSVFSLTKLKSLS
ncbi:unnamed protein product, partial [Didymodactylos carnosus]